MEILSKKIISRVEDKTFTRPNLTGYGTMGGGSAACQQSSIHSGSTTQAWKAFDNSSSTYWQSGTGTVNKNRAEWITFYNPYPINLVGVIFYHHWSNVWIVKSGVIQGSNDNSTWETLASISNGSAKQNYSISISSNKYYKYHRFYASTTKPNYSDGNWYCWALNDIKIYANYEVIG